MLEWELVPELELALALVLEWELVPELEPVLVLVWELVPHNRQQ